MKKDEAINNISFVQMMGTVECNVCDKPTKMVPSKYKNEYMFLCHECKNDLLIE